jgi:dTDP-4-amino-4,6-dideoxygalactose transaminase
VSHEKIPLLDLAAQNGPLHEEIRAAFERVARSNHFILGPEVDAFEREVAGRLGVAHAVGVSSGTDALLAALMAFGVGAGDEVITTAFSFFATAGTIARVGATPVFVDIDPVTFNLDPSRVAAAITPRTRALMPVHLFGQACDMLALRAIAGPRAIPIIEDAAQAIGAESNAGTIGGAGAIGCFSFFPSKNLGAFGDAGLCTTDDPKLAADLKLLRAHGAKPKYFHARIGGNFRLDALQAAILRVKLPHLDRWTAGRRANAERFDALFAEAKLPPEVLRTPRRVQESHIYNQYVIRTPRRDELRGHLESRGIATEIYYPLGLHLQQCFAHLGHRPGSLPETERATAEALALPIFPELGEARLSRIAAAVVEFLR